MSIAKKPTRHRSEVSEKKAAERFIAKAEASRSGGMVATTLRIDSELLARIDAAASRRGVSRSAWIKYTLSRVLEEEGAG